jgi:AI-2 transport system substrate-binding protein
MKKWNILKNSTVCLFILLAGGCARQNSGSKTVQPGDITVLLVPKFTGNTFFESANTGAQAYAEKYGFKIRYTGSPEALVDHQIAIINRAIAEKAQALCISSLDAQALDGVLKKAMAAGIKVITWDSDVSGDARQIMVSQGTPDQMGKMLVEMGAKSLAVRGVNLEGPVKYVWHYSQPTARDQNSWQGAGEKYIHAAYPSWQNVEPGNYYSDNDSQRAIAAGEEILKTYPDIDLIICNDFTSLPGQAQAAQNLGRNAQNITITGFAPPNVMREYCKAGILDRWGLWDCGVQGALGCYLAYYLAAGKQLRVGDRVDVPDIGIVEVMPNTVLDPAAYTSANSGVVLMPSRTEFTINNVDNYDF